MQRSKLVVAILGAACAMPLYAAEAPAKPTLGDVLEASGISVTGYLDVAYSKLSGTGAFNSTGSPNNRVFDAESESFNVHQAALTIAKQPAEGYGGVLNLTMGKDAKNIKSYDGQVSTTDYSNFDVTQAFIQYAVGSTTVIAGKFVTAAGAEVINSTSNNNYSRSILFGYAIPYTHTGLRATYAMNEKVSLVAGVNNGWDQTKDANKNKGVEFGLALTPSKSFSLNAGYHSGYEPIDLAASPTGTSGQRNLFDLVATYTVNDKLNFVINYDTGSQENFNGTARAKWSGYAAYANYQMNEKWFMSVRAESFSDKDGYRSGTIQEWKEATLTVAYAPNKSVVIRGEVRKDTSDVATFSYDDGIARKEQNSMGLQAIYKF